MTISPQSRQCYQQNVGVWFVLGDVLRLDVDAVGLYHACPASAARTGVVAVSFMTLSDPPT